MTTFVAFLRGINVGRARPVAMAELRAAVESGGYRDVKTVLRSGNVIFHARGSPASAAANLERAIAARLGLEVTVIIRTASELASMVAANPIPDKASDGSRMHVMFLGRRPTAEEERALLGSDFGSDLVRPVGREVYTWYESGMSGSDTAARLSKLLSGPSTDRNWNTVRRLATLTGSD